MRRNALFLLCAVISSSAMAAVGDVWDAKSQWSDYNNPSTISSPPYGSWSYRHGIGLGLLNRILTTPGGWSVDGTNSSPPPNLYRQQVSPIQQANEFYGHGPWVVRWQSPISGYVKITGTLLQMNEVDRRMKYQIRWNGITLLQGLAPEDPNGKTIIAFPIGLPATRAGFISFGPVITRINVGDTIDYAAIAGDGSEGGNAVNTAIFASFRIEQVAALDPWDAKVQWSDSANPNVISTSPYCDWSYRDAATGNLLLPAPGITPPGWSKDGTGNIPTLFNDQWTALQEPNEFGGHGPWLVRWTSPFGGYVKVTASMLQLFEPTRRMKLQFIQNGLLLQQVLTPKDQAGNTIVAYPTGNPGEVGSRSGLVTIGPVYLPISIGDRLDLAAVAADVAEGGNGVPTFVYAAYKIEPSEAPIPLPNIVGDVNRDDCVNLEDFLALANNWLISDCGPPRWCEAADVNQDHNVDLADFYYLAGNFDRCFTLLHNLGYIVISPYGPFDGGDYGPYTTGTQTAGFQEAFNYSVAHGKDVFIIGGGAGLAFGLAGPIGYLSNAPIYVPPAGYWRVTGGDYLLGFYVTGADMLVFDSLQNCQFKLGLIGGSSTLDNYDVIKLKPRNPNSDGAIGISHSSFLFNALMGSGDGWGTGPPGRGTALTIDATQGPVEHNEFVTMEINACANGFVLDQGDIRDNYFECPFDHITNNMIVVNSGTQNRFDVMLNPGGVGGSVVGLNLSGGAENMFHLEWAGWGSETPLIFGATARDNIVYARYGLPIAQVVNNATVPTNLIIPNEPIGYSVATPPFPASNTDVKNTTSLPIMAVIQNIGAVTSWTLTDADGGSQTISGALRAGQNIYLAPGDTIRFTYTGAPSWKWRAAQFLY